MNGRSVMRLELRTRLMNYDRVHDDLIPYRFFFTAHFLFFFFFFCGGIHSPLE